ncbi:hypothetical protein Dsin_028966 [Dipteronia sinensis]|uniref:DDE Tnp4 domain-containing protein n=1 Tax=Dipteronia sinensis TaxID=43782 RepID=A0AAD9ZRJ9_9ROSI|nr:hypothetical protein Dsin_028966 [Dipteronia sinensis]
MSQSRMYGENEVEEDEIEGEEIEGEGIEVDEIDEEETDGEDMDVKELEEDEEFYEIIKHLLIEIQVVVHVLNEFMIVMSEQYVERPLIRRRITAKGLNYVHNVLNQDLEHFRPRYRMYPDVFRKLCSILREKTLLQNTRFICVEEMLATFLFIVGHNNRYCLVRDTFGQSHFTVSINFNKVLKALNAIAPDILAKPGSLPSKLRESTRFYPYFKVNVCPMLLFFFLFESKYKARDLFQDCIGGIDGTHIPAMITGRDISSYRNRHGIISQNVLATCNFDLEFMYVLSGWEGSARDSKLLTDALTRRRAALKVPQVDCRFPNRRQFLAPFRGVRYHLQEFGSQGRDPANEVEFFNLRHASLRNVIERIFAIFKSRFTIFNYAPPFRFRTQTELVSACVELHNFILNKCRSDEFPIEQDNEVDPEPVNEVDPEPIFQT